MSLADECVSFPTVVHEFMHVIGFIHEHQRNDRDNYVNIKWRNIISGKFCSWIVCDQKRLSVAACRR